MFRTAWYPPFCLSWIIKNLGKYREWNNIVIVKDGAPPHWRRICIGQTLYLYFYFSPAVIPKTRTVKPIFGCTRWSAFLCGFWIRHCFEPWLCRALEKRERRKKYSKTVQSSRRLQSDRNDCIVPCYQRGKGNPSGQRSCFFTTNAYFPLTPRIVSSSTREQGLVAGVFTTKLAMFSYT